MFEDFGIFLVGAIVGAAAWKFLLGPFLQSWHLKQYDRRVNKWFQNREIRRGKE